MYYVVTEPGLTHLTYAQKLSATAVAKLQHYYQADAFTVAPYTQKLQRSLRTANANDCTRYTEAQVLSFLNAH
mgnify:CR=1 FL=1